MKKLVINSGKAYVMENKEDYNLTDSYEHAKDFRWCWLWFSKKTFLKGINKRFGSGWEFKWM
jgi:hypothetical protein